MGDLGSFSSTGVERECRKITRLIVTNTEDGKMEISEGFQICSVELACAFVLVT